jgi:hypothetical protein
MVRKKERKKVTVRQADQNFFDVIYWKISLIYLIIFQKLRARPFNNAPRPPIFTNR